ncbi:MAG: histidine phosphatase family protein [Mycobacterium sp.]|nr:histidine phosphatase family protein [Mycobacterium sp.]
MHRSLLRSILGIFAALMAVVLMAACSSSNPEVRQITLTLVRHAESTANAKGLINTKPPGPPLSAEGQKQAEALASKLKGGDYDGVYSSELLRSEQTAEPAAKALDEKVEVLPGLNEISAGWYEDLPVDRSEATYLLPMNYWLTSNRKFTIPGSVNGNQFNAQFSDAVQHIYDSGNNKPIAFSSGNAIMMWVLLNVTNPKDSLRTDHPLPNTGRVVVTGNPVTGWTLKEWDGITDFSVGATGD